MTRRSIFLLLPICGSAALAALMFTLPVVYSRMASPDGRHHAVATVPRWTRWIPSMPGQAGDASGAVEVFTSDGRSCGATPVEMISLANALEWNTDRAEIRAVAEWDLALCRIHPAGAP